jgi:hypothetical protein
MSRGMAGTNGGENVKVLDIAEVLLSRQAAASTGSGRQEVIAD